MDRQPAELDDPARIVANLSTPEDAVNAWAVLHEYYLAGTRRHDYPSPPVHYRWIYDARAHFLNAFTAPRNFAKSTILALEWPILVSLACPGSQIIIVLSTYANAIERGRRFLAILSGQVAPLLARDFGAQVSWSTRTNPLLINMANGSVIRITSAGACQLGRRADLIILDDPEPDPQFIRTSIAWERHRARFKDLVLGTLINMLDPSVAGPDRRSIPTRPAGMIYVATQYDRRSFCYYLHHSSDPDVQQWNRVFTSILDNCGQSTWPERFTPSRIALLRSRQGPHRFAIHCLNRPGDASVSGLGFDPDKHLFQIIGDVPTDPAQMSELIRDGSRRGIDAAGPKVRYRAPLDDPAGGRKLSDPAPDPAMATFERPLAELLASSARIALVDFAPTVTDTSDFSAVVVEAIDPDDRLFILDAWAGRAGIDAICARIEQMIYRWHCVIVGVEAIALYTGLLERLRSLAPRLVARHGWVPRIIRVTHPTHLSKGERIASCEWRFRLCRIHILAEQQGAMGELVEQIRNFTPELDLLEHDDLIDAAFMYPAVGRFSRRYVARPGAHEALEAELAAAEASRTAAAELVRIARALSGVYLEYEAAARAGGEVHSATHTRREELELQLASLTAAERMAVNQVMEEVMRARAQAVTARQEQQRHEAVDLERVADELRRQGKGVFTLMDVAEVIRTGEKDASR